MAAWIPSGHAIATAVVVAASLASGILLLSHLIPRGAVAPPAAYPIVTVADAPGDAVAKSHARYLLNWADSLEEFSNRADTFEESGDAAKWFADRTAKARTDAYGGSDGFDAYVFGHAGSTPAGEDRYDAKTLATGAREMALSCRRAAAKITAR